MCFAIAGKVISVEDCEGVVLVDGVQRNVSFIALPQSKAGDYVLVSLGMAVEVITEEEARHIDSAWDELSRIEPTMPRNKERLNGN